MRFTRVALILAALLVAGSAAPLASAQTPEEQQIVESISAKVRAEFGIRVATWKPAAGGLPAHAFIVVSTAQDAVYDAAGDLIQVGETVPVSCALRVPAHRLAGRLILHIPPGTFEHTISPVGALPALMAEGYPVILANQVQWFDARLDGLGNPHPSADELMEAYEDALHVAKKLYRRLFGKPTHTYVYGLSRGVQIGFGPMRHMKSLCDGQLLLGGTGGDAARIPGVIESAGTGLVPKTGIPVPSTGPNAPLVKLTEYIGHVDPEYFALIESGAASALDYDVSTRPRSVTDWDFSGKLRVPTIIIQGLADSLAYPYEQVTFANRINAARRTDLYRLYFVPHLIHNPQAAPPHVAAFHMLEAWVERRVAPGSLDYSAPGPVGFPGLPAPVENSHQLGLECDPDAYFHLMLARQQ